ncbi:MAG: NAD(P)/FAD-dependent oxidoreductase, partial [Myxococcota bacterium]
MKPSDTPHVVIVGGGFGGLYAARALGGAPLRVTLIDRRNHHLFQPLLYQVATAGLSPADIAAPLRKVLRRQRNATVLLAEATAIDVAAKKIVLADGDVPYDFAIVATGATHSYFSHPEWARLAPGLKSIEDALEIRRRVLLAFEMAESEAASAHPTGCPDSARRKAHLTFLVVGGGATGVELAGALAEVARHALARDFRRIDPRMARVVLLEAGARILPTFSPELSESAVRQLLALGVEVQTGAMVTGLDEGGVWLGDERIEAAAVLWAAGVAASPLGRSLGAPLDRAGRVRVRSDLTVPGRDDVFVIGDLAALEQDGKLMPGVAPAAIQEGRYVARVIEARVRGLRSPPPFRYRDRGSLATIGRASAIAQIGRFKLSGFLAWLAWLLVHILFLIGFRNRFLVLFEWAWQYLSWERGARL